MIKRIQVLSRHEILSFLNFSITEDKHKYMDWHFISIYSVSKDVVLTKNNIKKFKSVNMKEYLSLMFDDVTSPGEDLNGNSFVLFNKDHAKQIIEILDKIKKYSKNSRLIIHCDAGISRSGAVGLFAAKYLNYDLDKFIKDNSHIWPNEFVLSTLVLQAFPNQLVSNIFKNSVEKIKNGFEKKHKYFFLKEISFF